VPTFLFGGGKQESRFFGRLSSGIQVSFEAFISGGADQDRTDYLLNAIQAVSLKSVIQTILGIYHIYESPR